MDRLKPFMRRTVDGEALRAPDRLAAFGARGRWIPDPIDDFCEAEIALSLDDARDLVVTMALEKRCLARMMLGWAPKGDDDADPSVLTPEELAKALELCSEDLVRLLGVLFPG